MSLLRISPLFTLLLFSLVSCAMGEEESDFTRYVDPFIGTGGHGHTHPAAVVPHGMIQPGPDTRIHGWDACSGYHYTDSLINGFAQTRLSGTGCADFGDFLFMPVVDEALPAADVAAPLPDAETQHTAWASPFSHADEEASPDYYRVRLLRYGITTEITSTPRAALYRFTYLQSDSASLLIDLAYNIQEQDNLALSYTVVNDTTLLLYKCSRWWQYRQDIHGCIITSRPFQAEVVAHDAQLSLPSRLLLRFGSMADADTLLVKCSVSSVDAEGARRNLLAEIPDWDFSRIHRAGVAAWNALLSRIRITTADVAQRTLFYTALYHTHIAPNLHQDVDGRYLGMDLQIHQGDVADPLHTNYSLWDTFRALHPLYSILWPEQNESAIRSLMRMADEGGMLPKWPCGSNYTGCMIGYHFASLLADAYAKGYRHYDARRALQMAVKSSLSDTTGITSACPRWLFPHEMPEARRLNEALGYIPCDRGNESVARALEYAYDDWCIALVADSLQEPEIAARYYQRSQHYRRYFDASTGFMRGIDSEGQWRTPFDPRSSSHRSDDYCEGNAWQWSWFAPHDIPGLISLYGGTGSFAARLDTLFSTSSDLHGDAVSADISGLMGQYAHGNEPSHHITHLYNYAGRPERTQELTTEILTTLYSAAPDGLSGNEDCGQMSAWYLLNALGLYQVCPCRPLYSLTRPLFPEATLLLPNGRQFTIRTEGEGPHIGSIRLEGRLLDSPFLTHEELMAGGALQISLTQ